MSRAYRPSDFVSPLWPNGAPECRNADGRPVYLTGLCGDCFARQGQAARRPASAERRFGKVF